MVLLLFQLRLMACMVPPETSHISHTRAVSKPSGTAPEVRLRPLVKTGSLGTNLRTLCGGETNPASCAANSGHVLRSAVKDLRKGRMALKLIDIAIASGYWSTKYLLFSSLS